MYASSSIPVQGVAVKVLVYMPGGINAPKYFLCWGYDLASKRKCVRGGGEGDEICSSICLA